MPNEKFSHEKPLTTGILLVNLGTPDEATPKAIKRYLAEFLWDPRVVEFPRALWWLILHGVILQLRPKRTAKNYQKIWTEQGSPLWVNSQLQQQALQQHFDAQQVKVVLAMRYGHPSIQSAIAQLYEAQVNRLIVLPLYPQYSATTTASVFDAVTDELKKHRWLPHLRFISEYASDENYIAALAQSVEQHWQQHGKNHLLFSFHGIPKRYFDKGDPYYCYCAKTTRLVANKLGLSDDEWQLVFQSRFGREPWLQPYADKTLQALPAKGIKKVDVICPGFAVDCLETLEEIALLNRQLFLDKGGEQYHYIPALNASAEHIHCLAQLLKQHGAGWY